MADDISKRIEKLLETLQTRAKSIEIGSVRVTKEDIKNQEILLKQLIEERKEAVRKNEIKGDEVEKTQSLIDKNKELLRLLKQSRMPAFKCRNFPIIFKIRDISNQIIKYYGIFGNRFIFN